MRYLLLIGVAHGFAPSAEEEDEIDSATQRWAREMDDAGIRLHGHEVVAPDQAVKVRVRDGARTVTDGPFAESKEFVAGYDVLECRDLDEAIEVAAGHPMARHGVVEVRAFVPDAPNLRPTMEPAGRFGRLTGRAGRAARDRPGAEVPTWKVQTGSSRRRRGGSS